MSPRLGEVLLVGAGPGPVDLMTVRAHRAVEAAEVLLYDALVPRGILDLAPSACLRIQTGKRAGRASMAQETINRLMLRLARQGRNVVRLKGGDPSIFGRVGEESAFLRAHGIPVEIVPGVTAACAAAAQFDFPLTHRGLARRVVFLTATVKDGALAGDWSAAADPQATLAIYMGGAAAGQIRDCLIAAGRSVTTPALMIENIGRPQAAATRGVLADLPTLASGASGGPVLLILGDVAALATIVPELKSCSDKWGPVIGTKHALSA
jgi:uroporphyrin-III C-methyltransferase